MTGKISDLAPNTNDKRKEEYIITGSISACKPPIYDEKIEPPSQWYHNQGDAKYTSYEKPDTYLWLAEENTKQANKIECLQEQLKEANQLILSCKGGVKNIYATSIAYGHYWAERDAKSINTFINKYLRKWGVK